jgi:hypothetical protein
MRSNRRTEKRNGHVNTEPRNRSSLSSDHVHVVARRSDHFVQGIDGQPRVVIGAVNAVVHAVRNRTSLPPCTRLFSGPDVRCRS